MFSIIAVFVMLSFTGVISAADNPIGDWFASWENADISANRAKYLLWGLVAILIYGVADMIPGLSGNKQGKPWIRAGFSILVAFLGLAYITVDEVTALMTAYSGMGFVLGGAIPFMVLLFFTIRLASGSRKNASGPEIWGRKAIAVSIWIAFAIFLFVKAWTGTFSEELEVSSWQNIVQWILLGISLIAIISMGFIFRKVISGIGQQVREAAQEVQANADATTQRNNESTQYLGGGS